MSHLSDTTNPEVLSTFPSDGSPDVALGANLVLTFDESVEAGSGVIEIRYALNGSLALSIDVSDTSQVTFSGDTMTIDPSVDLDPFTPYYVLIGGGVVTDLSNNPFAGILQSNIFNFLTVDPDPLNLISTSPSDNALDVSIGANLTLTFDEEIEARSGTFSIRYSADHNVAMEIDATDSSQVSFSGNTVTINPSANLDPSTGYYVVIGSYAISGTDGSGFSGFSSSTDFNFVTGTDTTNPELLSTSPPDGFANVALDANLVFTFDEAVEAGSGAIELRDGRNGSLLLSFGVNDTSQVSFSGSTMTIDPSVDLDPHTPYYFGIDEGVVADLAGNPWDGIPPSISLNFLTIDPDPLVLVSSSPADDALGVPLYANLTLTFDEEVEAGVGGNISIRNSSDHTLTMVIDANDTSQVSFSGNTVTVNPSTDLEPNTVYWVTIGAWAIAGIDGSGPPTINSSTDLNFVTAIGTSIAFGVDDPTTYMDLIRDFDGNDLGGDNGWVLIGSTDIQNDGDDEYILVNREIGRWATVGPAADGLVYFAHHGWGGDTRVVGIYIDPEVVADPSKAGGPFDSQQRFQNDLLIENINDVLGAGDYDGDGLQESYFGLTDETAYLHAYMHADGNIQYADYQSEAQMMSYLSGFGYGAETWGDWLYGDAAASSAGASGTINVIAELPSPWSTSALAVA